MSRFAFCSVLPTRPTLLSPTCLPACLLQEGSYLPSPARSLWIRLSRLPSIYSHAKAEIGLWWAWNWLEAGEIESLYTWWRRKRWTHYMPWRQPVFQSGPPAKSEAWPPIEQPTAQKALQPAGILAACRPGPARPFRNTGDCNGSLYLS